jgi:hypothetical protein
MKYKILNLAMFAVMILFNFLANFLPLNGKTTGELSDQYTNLFVPAGITFSIWGLIYLLILGLIILQFKNDHSDILSQVGWLFAITCLFNALWIVAWHYELLPLSLVLMTGLLITLILLSFKFSDYPISLVKATLGIYLGWICIATIANVTAILVSINWSGWGISNDVWAIAMIGIGALISVFSIIKFNNPFIGLSVVWAFIGINIKRSNDFRTIVITTFFGIVVVGVFTGLAFAKEFMTSKS